MAANEIRSIIRTAFFDVAFSKDHAQLDYAVCESLRERLLITQPYDFPYFIAHFMLDLILTHRKDSFVDEGAIAVLRFLDGFWPVPVDTISGIDEIDLRIARHKLAAFRALSHDQEKAILAYLLHIRDWPELCIAEDYLESAIHYWSEPRHRITKHQ